MKNKLILWAAFILTLSTSLSQCTVHSEISVAAFLAYNAQQKKLKTVEKSWHSAARGGYNSPATLEVIKTLTDITDTLEEYPELKEMVKKIHYKLIWLKEDNESRRLQDGNSNSCCTIS